MLIIKSKIIILFQTKLELISKYILHIHIYQCVLK
jgi:hypothetical protein